MSINRIKDDRGALTVFQNGVNCAFKPMRIFFLEPTTNSTRGHHSHLTGRILCICLKGSFDIELEYYDKPSVKITLNSNEDKSLEIPEKCWHVLKNFAPNTIIAVICELEFNEDHYIRDYEIFKREKTLHTS